MSSHFIFEKLGIALMLGFLVGLQREKAQSLIAGFRTFPLITIYGTLCALLAQVYGPLILFGGTLGLIALIIIGNVVVQRAADTRTGVTTEVSMLIMFAVGAYLVVGPVLVSVAVGGGIAVLLQFKPELHGFASRLGDSDLKAIMRFVLLSFIVLPILPNEVYGPFEVLNPHEIWLMVVFIVGLNLAGYIISKFIGPRAGIFWTGILSGLVSSTAATVSFTHVARRDPKSTACAATIILIASTFVYLRVLAEIAALSPILLRSTLVPIGCLFGFSFLLCIVSYFATRANYKAMAERKHPGEVRSALMFGITYAVVVIATAAAKKYWGTGSLYWVAGISGLTDVDAITLSSARLVMRNQLDPSLGTQMILIAVLSNLAFKIGIIALAGDRRLLLHVGGLFGLCIGFGTAVLLLF